MGELYRFDVDYIDEEQGMKHIPCDNGDYVLAEDALALQAKVEELEEKLHWKVVSHIAADDRIEELEERVKWLEINWCNPTGEDI